MKLTFERIILLHKALQHVEKQSGNGHGDLRLDVRGSYRLGKSRLALGQCIDGVLADIRKKHEGLTDPGENAKANQASIDAMMKEELEVDVRTVELERVVEVPHGEGVFECLGALQPEVFNDQPLPLAIAPQPA